MDVYRTCTNFTWTQLRAHCDFCRQVVDTLDHITPGIDYGILIAALFEHQLNDRDRRAFYARVLRRLLRQENLRR